MSAPWKPRVTRTYDWSLGVSVYEDETEYSFVWGTKYGPTYRYVILALGHRTFEWSWEVLSAKLQRIQREAEELQHRPLFDIEGAS